jgi:hypothetical protein
MEDISTIKIPDKGAVTAGYSRNPEKSIDILSTQLAKNKWTLPDIEREYNKHDADYKDKHDKLERIHNFMSKIDTSSNTEASLEKYEAPWDVETLNKKGLERLLKSPQHLWRAETGIELLHKEPTIDEFSRIWNNWHQMTPDMKKKSDEKSKELFGMTNKEHFKALLKEYRKHDTDYKDMHKEILDKAIILRIKEKRLRKEGRNKEADIERKKSMALLANYRAMKISDNPNLDLARRLSRFRQYRDIPFNR